MRDIAHAETELRPATSKPCCAILGIDTLPVESHILEVWNKIDLLSPEARDTALAEARIPRSEAGLDLGSDGRGIAALLDAIDARLGVADEVVTLSVPAREGRLMHWLYENARDRARDRRRRHHHSPRAYCL